MSGKKILPLKDMILTGQERKKQGRRLVLAHGCFDLLHIGHIRYLEEAKEMGDVLMVTISPDEYVDKGPNRPAFTAHLRAEALASLSSVDFVALNDSATATSLLERLRPDIYVKGADFAASKDDPTGKLQEEARICDRLGISMRFTDDIVFSSSNLINRFLSSWPEELHEYLQIFRTRYSIDKIMQTIEDMSSLKVLIIGDAILDEYRYLSPLGMSSKYPVMAMLKGGGDLYAGGVFAIANHLAGFAGEVNLLTVLGEDRPYEDFITKALLPNVKVHYEYLPAAPTTRKTRYIEGYTTTRLLEVYDMKDDNLPNERDLSLRQKAKELGEKADIIIAADFGHGCISKDLAEDLCTQKNFLAVNTQCNAGNKMIHTISRYSRADYISLTENELRLDLRDNARHMRTLGPYAARKYNAKMVMTTRGKKGCSVSMPDGGFVEVPAFAVKSVDSVGSGDALFAISSLTVRLGAEAEMTGFLGNAAGALATQTMGNAKAIRRADMEKTIRAMLK